LELVHCVPAVTIGDGASNITRHKAPVLQNQLCQIMFWRTHQVFQKMLTLGVWTLRKLKKWNRYAPFVQFEDFLPACMSIHPQVTSMPLCTIFKVTLTYTCNQQVQFCTTAVPIWIIAVMVSWNPLASTIWDCDLAFNGSSYEYCGFGLFVFFHWFSYADVVMRLQEYTMQVLMPGDDVPRFIAWTAPHRIPPVLDPTEISLWVHGMWVFIVTISCSSSSYTQK